MERVYKIFIVKARREGNGKEFEAEFYAGSKEDARCCFSEYYRHGDYTILEVTEKNRGVKKVMGAQFYREEVNKKCYYLKN